MKTQNTLNDLELDRLGRHFSAQLTLATPGLPHDITERLRVARLQAIAHRKPALQSRLVKNIQINSHSTLTASADEGLNIWSFLGSALPLLALLIGLMVMDRLTEDQIATELAAIDSALLTDELPPDAYTDVGFIQYLKQGHGQRTTHD